MVIHYWSLLFHVAKHFNPRAFLKCRALKGLWTPLAGIREMSTYLGVCCRCPDSSHRPWTLLTWQQNRKQTFLFFFPQRTSFKDESLWLWIPLSLFSSSSVWRQIRWFPVCRPRCSVPTRLPGHFSRERRASSLFAFFSYIFHNDFNGSSVIVFVHGRRSWHTVRLNKKTCYFVCVPQKSQTLKIICNSELS